MIKKIPLLFFFLLIFQSGFSQNDTIYLKEIILSDTSLLRFSETQSVIKLKDSVLQKNQASLTSLLNYNSVIYFKENGLGMVSSPSFRGTSASQTAVIWNGININSQMNGQTDFSTINIRNFNGIAVKAGGGSIAYGSSAIGGSIHLNNDLHFTNSFTNDLFLNYGSFNTHGISYRTSVSTDKVSAQVSFSRNSSDNDYDYVGSKRKNLNGQYYNNNMSAAVGYKFNDKNILKLYSNFFDGERHFSLIFPSEVKTKYNDLNIRNMLEWTGFYGKFTSKAKVAHISEEYKYFQNLNTNNYSFGKAESLLFKYDLAYDVLENIKISTVVDFMQVKGNGSSIKDAKREIGSASLFIKHFVSDKFLYEAGVRQEMTDNYGDPFLFSAGTKYAVSDFYNVKLNVSKNFRAPTYNDLYWEGSGNPNLKPETSLQAEIGNELFIKDVSLQLTGYYIKIKDMLRWIPSGNTTRPINTNAVQSYGAEAILSWKKKINKNHFDISGTYAYTISKNEETQKQLIYVPFHKLTGALAYTRKNFSAYYQYLFNGEVFTRENNNSKYILANYKISNIGLDYNFGNKNVYKLGLQVLNVWNEKYQSVESRMMPGRNFNIYLTLNI